jgi:uncharacterized protein YjeT (DUF2065 family)
MRLFPIHATRLRRNLVAGTRLVQMTYATLQRIVGAVLVAAGCVILVVDVTRFDAVVLSVGRSHGLHLSDVMGGAAVVVGVALLWVAPARDR